jgi:hypothetical protein
VIARSYPAKIQNLFKAYLPDLFGLYLIAAISMALGAACLVGMVLERCVIRFLYGRHRHCRCIDGHDPLFFADSDLVVLMQRPFYYKYRGIIICNIAANII